MTKILAAWGKPRLGGVGRALIQDLLAERLIDGVKFGLEVASGLNGIVRPLEWARGKGAYALADLKLFGTPKTIGRAVSSLASFANGITIAAPWGSDDSLRAAVEAKGSATLFGCSVLTSLEEDEAPPPWHTTLEAQRQAAYRFERLGVDGITLEYPELQTLRAELGFEACNHRTLVLGIRPAWADWISDDDQKRTATPREAAEAGADFIALDRALFGAPNVREAARLIREETGGTH